MERAAPCNDVPVIAIKTSIGNKKGQHLRRSDLKKAKQLLLWLASSPKSVCVILPGCSCYTCQPMIYTSQRQSHPTERDIHRTLCTHGLTLNWHSVSVLVPLALNTIDMVSNNKLINWAQLHAKKEWALWWGNGKSKAARQLRSVDLSKSIPDANAFLRKPMQIFNGFFFGGRLPKITFVWADLPCGMYGETVEQDYIELNGKIREHFLQPTAVLCTILHEMIHAYLR